MESLPRSTPPSTIESTGRRATPRTRRIGRAIAALALTALFGVDHAAAVAPPAPAPAATPAAAADDRAHAADDARAAEPDANRPTQEPAGATPEDGLAEIEVTGERPGPGLWRIVNGDRTLYVLGTLRPLPKKMQWRSRELEGVLDRAQLLIPERPDVDANLGPIKAVKLWFQWRKLRRNPDDRTLAEVLPPDLYARFDALRTRYVPGDDGMLELRPLLAAGELWNAALKKSGLTLRIDIDDQVRRLAKQRRVEIAEPKLEIEDAQSLLQELGRVPLDAEFGCMAATLDRLEADLADARTLAEAWATGDVEALRARAEWRHEDACWATLTSAPKLLEVRRRYDQVWLDAAFDAIATRETTVAIAPLAFLLKPGGVLEQMKQRGYEVIEP